MSPPQRILYRRSAVEPQEIKTLYRRFRRLDRGGKGTISTDDLLMIPEVSMNPLAQRLTALFQRDAEDRINFKSFVAGLSVFAGRARPEVRRRGQLPGVAGTRLTSAPIWPNAFHSLSLCWSREAAAVFRLYDVDEDGAISRADLTKLLGMMVGRSMTPEQMATVVNMTLEEADRDGDGRISFEDFERVSQARRLTYSRRLPMFSSLQLSFTCSAWLHSCRVLVPSGLRVLFLVNCRAWKPLPGTSLPCRSKQARAGKQG